MIRGHIDSRSRSRNAPQPAAYTEKQGDLDAAQRQRLLEIADRCPVHRTLVGEVRVDTRLAE